MSRNCGWKGEQPRAGAEGTRPQLAGYGGSAAEPHLILLAHKRAAISKSISTAPPPSARPTRRGSATWCWKSAITTIMDCEDSIAAVDAQDKVGAYRNWLGLMDGSLSASFEKGGKTLERKANPDRNYRLPDGEPLWLPRPLAALHPQCRSPDDVRRDPAAGRQRDRRRPDGRRGHQPDRDARQEAQQPHRQHLYRPSPRCTAPPRSPSPTPCSTASKTCWG